MTKKQVTMVGKEWLLAYFICSHIFLGQSFTFEMTTHKNYHFICWLGLKTVKMVLSNFSCHYLRIIFKNMLQEPLTRSLFLTLDYIWNNSLLWHQKLSRTLMIDPSWFSEAVRSLTGSCLSKANWLIHIPLMVEVQVSCSMRIGLEAPLRWSHSRFQDSVLLWRISRNICPILLPGP